jgi:polyhydroxyalkanoate synthesis repressor PhaR
MGTERVIKRYTNRKLYDTDQSRYVTLDDIARLIRENEEVRVIDNETQDDLTAITFAQIILEEEKKKTNLVSVPFLRKLIHSGEAAMQDLSDSAKRAFDQLGGLTGNVVEKGGRAIDEVVEEGRGFIDELMSLPQRRLESLQEVARKQVDRIRHSPSLQREIERLEKSIHSIEQMLTRLRDADEHEGQFGQFGEEREEGDVERASEPKPGDTIVVTEEAGTDGDTVITGVASESVMDVEPEPEEMQHKPRASGGSRG